MTYLHRDPPEIKDSEIASGVCGPGPIIKTHWPPPDGADSWQTIGAVVERILTEVATKMQGKAA